MSVNLVFDPEAHRYLLNGKAIPSVTQVLEPLQELDGVAKDTLEAARVFGQHVHQAIHLDIHKMLEWSNLDIKLVPYVEAARKFRKELELRILVSEYHMGDPDLKYGGTLDILGIIKQSTWVLDWKSNATMPRTAGPQTAAYDALYRRNLGGTRPYKRAAVQLFDDGTYKLHPFTESRDYSIFTSALNIWHWMNPA